MKTTIDFALQWAILERNRLLTLLLIVLVGVGKASNQVDGRSIRAANPLQYVGAGLFNNIFNKNITNQIEKNQSGGSTQIRKHLLYNMCSNRYVKIMSRNARRKGVDGTKEEKKRRRRKNKRNGINARGKKNGKELDFSKLIFESTSHGTIRIFGEKNGLQICFNRHGKLVAKQIRKKNKRACEFQERYSADRAYTRFRSADPRHPWFMAFDKNGKPIREAELSNNENSNTCLNFLKMPRTDKSVVKPDCRSSGGNGPLNVNFCDNSIWKLLTSEGHKKRHSAQRQKSRRNG